MLSLIFKLYGELLSQLSRLITGRIFTDEQIRSITSGAVGKYFADFFPTPKDEQEAQDKVNTARKHISAASTIILEMQQNLESQNQNLEHVLKEIEEKRNLAERYETLAKTNQQEFAAFREEMEESLRKELEEQTAKGSRLRQVVSLLIWIITLVAGAALGAYFKDIIGVVKGAMAQP
jgi:CHASE3 domain sensor protein